MTNEQIAAVAEKALRPLLGPHGLQQIDVRSGEDHDGEPSLFLAARYKAGSRVPRGDVLLEALGVVQEALRGSGENRFPYLDHRFADEGFEEDEANDEAERP
ncbi:MAG TPA: hypothetical protein VIL65_02030 [Beijerinckiaceae bacterium]